MKLKTFYTPRYVIKKTFDKIYQRNNQNLPWMSKQANEILVQILDKKDTVLEFGSGRSTFFLSKFVNYVYSIEHDALWFQKVKDKLERNNVTNVHLILKEKEEDYIDLDYIESDTIDVLIVDGRFRGLSLQNALCKLRENAVIIVDNSQRYFSNNRFKTKTPVITRHSSRDSLWKDLDGELFAKYRAITVSNDIEDTTFFFKR
jgi:hypothetical protein